jgi:hypothetical protein
VHNKKHNLSILFCRLIFFHHPPVLLNEAYVSVWLSAILLMAAVFLSTNRQAGVVYLLLMDIWVLSKSLQFPSVVDRMFILLWPHILKCNSQLDGIQRWGLWEVIRS